ncbi:hypothetical protein FGG08_002250 [Glutinoglossum americanum]|uniref:Uncharacterized protein n=1 Tax=Glutinoglossum americanum TaxID=1670608 RepID=A0A9P8ID57_9PEZI|nr:hypothetical protein FGG08_002250 [Glutinoglossum americanum]
MEEYETGEEERRRQREREEEEEERRRREQDPDQGDLSSAYPGQHQQQQQSEEQRSSTRAYRILWAMTSLISNYRTSPPSPRTPLTYPSSACFALALVAGIGCTSTPTNMLHLYSVRPADLAQRLGNLTGGRPEDFLAAWMPDEWRVGFSGVCAVSSSLPHCEYKFCPTLDFGHLVSAASQGRDPGVLDRWESAMAALRSRHDVVAGKQMSSGAGALLVLALAIWFLLLPAPVFDNGSFGYNAVATVVFVLHGGLLLGAGLLQRCAGRTAIRVGFGWGGVIANLLFGGLARAHLRREIPPNGQVPKGLFE